MDTEKAETRWALPTGISAFLERGIEVSSTQDNDHNQYHKIRLNLEGFEIIQNAVAFLIGLLLEKIRKLCLCRSCRACMAV